ncbi:MAG TPA: L,D-transpeptidase [Longimicrobiales bacterium]|nr:L,D-transpeptidase [Longimicrobiales bacterium]
MLAAGFVALVALWLAATRAAGVGPWTRSDAPVSLEVNLSARTLTVRREGDVVNRYDIAVGTSEHPTPTGDFSISTMVWNPAWVPPNSDWARGKEPQEPGSPSNPMQGVKMYFREPTYFIHGTNDPESIGAAASHGCIRMAVGDAEELARMLMEETGAGSPPSGGETRYVTLPSAVPLEIHE